MNNTKPISMYTDQEIRDEISRREKNKDITSERNTVTKPLSEFSDSEIGDEVRWRRIIRESKLNTTTYYVIHIIAFVAIGLGIWGLWIK